MRKSTWGNNVSATGGMLDQDSNIECVIDNKNNESIRWTKAPSGIFAVRLDYYSSCGVSETKYVLAVNHNGTSELYQGRFTGPGSNGAVGKERLITTLNVSGSLTSSQGSSEVAIDDVTAVEETNSCLDALAQRYAKSRFSVMRVPSFLNASASRRMRRLASVRS